MKSLTYVLFLSVLFTSIGQVASDLYLPSLPAIAIQLHTSTHWVQATVFLYMVGFAGALIPFPKIAGIATAVVGTIQILGGSLSSGIMSLLPDDSQWPLAMTFIVCGMLMSLLLKRTLSNQQKN